MYKIFTTSLALVLALAQYPVTTSAQQTHLIVVGFNGTLTYNPNNINASIDDIIEFAFEAKNHTVTQSAFSTPCEPLAINATTGIGGFNTGFDHFTTATDNTTVGFQFKVNNTNPIWFYCAQKVPVSHCASGMVGAINAPTSGNTFTKFLALAEASNSTNSSSSATPSGTSGASSTSGGSGTSTNTGSGAASSSTSGAISTSLNLGLTAFLGVVGVFILAL